MIQTRNQNLIKQQNINKPKQNKKLNKPNKQQDQTDIEQQKNINNIKLANNNNFNNKIHKNNANNNIQPSKPKKPLPKLEIQFDPRDQVEQYQNQIIAYLKQQQQKYKINQNYLKFHKTLNSKIRNFLIKFIFKIIWKYKCKRSTLYLSIYILDYYLSKNQNINSNNQCIVIAQASIYIAMKFEQIYPPGLKQWTADVQQVRKILLCEAQILKKLQFKLNLPSIAYFQQYLQKKYSQTQSYQQNKQNLYILQQKISLIADICLFDCSLYQFQPYDVAINIRRMVYNLDIPFKHERIVLNIKWILQRNRSYIEWLKQSKYKDLAAK